ncbi:hypothetical protein [Caulobacter segnis]
MVSNRTARRTTTPGPRKAPAKRAPANDIPMLEWIAATVGLVLAATAIGLTAWDALFGVKGPPVIEVRLTRVTPTAHGYVAEIEAFNHGGAPAAQVEIEGAIAGHDPAGLTIDYIPEQSSASGGLIFEDDPRAGRLVLRAKGFSDAS